jgi:hypothetical protein
VVQNSGLFVGIAEIAGVFVGFAALIGITGRDEVEPSQLGQIRAVVTIGLAVIAAALIPVGLAAYGVSDRTLWFWSSLAYLLLDWGLIVLSLRRPENRQVALAQVRTSPVGAALFWVLLEIPIQVPLILAVLGVSREHADAFYTTALVFHLFEAAFVLVQLVYAQAGRPRS